MAVGAGAGTGRHARVVAAHIDGHAALHAVRAHRCTQALLVQIERERRQWQDECAELMAEMAAEVSHPPTTTLPVTCAPPSSRMPSCTRALRD